MSKDTPGFDWFLEKLMADRPGPHADEEFVVETTKMIWSNLQDLVSIDSIVAELPTTRRTLERRFRDHFGRSIRGVVAFARLELAKWLLTGTSLPIHVIATQVGYSSSDWMGKVVRQDTGTTPSEYQGRSR